MAYEQKKERAQLERRDVALKKAQEELASAEACTPLRMLLASLSLSFSLARFSLTRKSLDRKK